MKEYLPEEAVKHLKKLQFSKSWQNVYVSKAKKILNTETGQLENTSLEHFVYVPSSTLVHALSQDKDFMSFRLEYKNSKDWDYKLVSDAFENNNRRLAIFFLQKCVLKPLDLKFFIDDSYTLYISKDELQRHIESKVPGMKEFINSFYIPKTISTKKGSSETYS